LPTITVAVAEYYVIIIPSHMASSKICDYVFIRELHLFSKRKYTQPNSLQKGNEAIDNYSFVDLNGLLDSVLPKSLHLVLKLRVQPKWYKHSFCSVHHHCQLIFPLFLNLYGVSGAGETERRT
jgi:hypothetical protein